MLVLDKTIVGLATGDVTTKVMLTVCGLLLAPPELTATLAV
jgi:hypothetical protein